MPPSRTDHLAAAELLEAVGHLIADKQVIVVLDIRVQARRDAEAARRFFRRLLKGLHYEPRVIVTGKLRSYGVAPRQLLSGVEQRQS